MAVTAFVITTMIEKRNNGFIDSSLKPLKFYYGLAVIAVVIGISAFAFPERQSDLLQEANNPELIAKSKFEMIDADELAFRLIDNDKSIQILDFRTKEEYKELSLPRSSNWTTDNIFGKDIHKKLATKHMKNIIITNDENEGMKLAYIANELGYKDIYVLKGGMPEFKNNILNFKRPETATRQMLATYDFRENASKRLPELIEANKKLINTDEKKTKRIIGGC
jgi:rhodanese-related sulfurtransferase